MAEVFLAQDAEDPTRHAVIKRMHPHLAAEPELVTMFLDEARLGMRLTHPNLCRFFDAAEVEGQPCIAMEHIEGVTLERLVERAALFGGLPHAIPLSIAAGVAGALDSVHRARNERGRPLGIVHRDVCPKNVMVGFDGRVKLLDFGIAKSLTNHSITEPGMAKGKLAYIAPEQWDGAEVDPRADVFALGVCLFEALSGRPLYHYARPLDVRDAITKGPVPSLRELEPGTPLALDALVSRCLAKDPADRYPSAGALEAAIHALLVELHESANRAELRGLLASLFAAEINAGPALEATDFGKDAALAPPPELPRRDDLPTLPLSAAADLPPHFLATAIYEAPTLAGHRRLSGIASALASVALVVGSAAAMLVFLEPDASPTVAERDGAELPTAAHAPAELPSTPGLAALAQPGLDFAAAELAESETEGAEFAESELGPQEPFALGPAEPAAAPAALEPVTLEPVAIEPAAYVAAPRRVAVARRTSESGAASSSSASVALPSTGTIDLNSQPWSEVFVDGQRLGYTPIGQHVTAVGQHTVRLVDRDGRVEERVVEVSAESPARLFVRFEGDAPTEPLAGL